MKKDKKYYDGLDKRSKEYRAYAKFNRLSNDDKVKFAQDTLKSASDMIDWDKVYEAKYVKGDVKIGLTDKPLEGHEFVVIKKKELKNELEDKIWVVSDTKKPEVIKGLGKVIKNKPKEILRPFKREHFEEYKEYKRIRTLDVWEAKSVELLVDLYAHVFAIQYNKADLTKDKKGSFKKLSKLSKELDEVYESYKRLNK